MNPAEVPEFGAAAIAAVAILTVLALAAHWWLRRRGLGVGAANPIRVVALRSLGGKRAVAVVEVERERFLLGLTDEAISCLGRLEATAAAERPRTFTVRANA